MKPLRATHTYIDDKNHLANEQIILIDTVWNLTATQGIYVTSEGKINTDDITSFRIVNTNALFSEVMIIEETNKMVSLINNKGETK